jgi:hypothetical protein
MCLVWTAISAWAIRTWIRFDFSYESGAFAQGIAALAIGFGDLEVLLDWGRAVRRRLADFI